MDSRKYDRDRAINLLKLYKSQLNKPDEKSLRRSMEKLIEALQSQLYDALIDIQELYEVTLYEAANGVQPLPEPITPIVREEIHAESTKPKRETSKKSKRSHKSEDSRDKEDGRKVNIQYQEELQPHEEYRYEQPQHVLQENFEPEQDVIEDNENPWLFLEIELQKGKKGYGFAVAGGIDKNHYDGDDGIFVTKIIPGGAAEVDSQLRIDDVIVSVNDTNLDYVNHDFAVDTLKNAGTSMILVVRRLRDDYYGPEEPPAAEDVAPPQQPAMTLFAPLPQMHQEEELSDDEGAQFYQFEIVLTKREGGGLGFSIHGGYDAENPAEDCYISVSRITPGGIAELDGHLEVGDILLMVDDLSLNGLSHDECANLLKNTGRTVKLFVGRFVEAPPPPEEPVIEKPVRHEERVPDKGSEKKKKKKHKHDRNEN